MIILGCLARNYIPEANLPFPDAWSVKIRAYCFGVLLLRGAMSINLKGKGLLVVILTIIPH
jgi:hypothetical protein